MPFLPPNQQCQSTEGTCDNYTVNYKIFQDHQQNSRRLPVFPGTISNSRRFPGVADTSTVDDTYNMPTHITHKFQVQICTHYSHMEHKWIESTESICESRTICSRLDWPITLTATRQATHHRERKCAENYNI